MIVWGGGVIKKLKNRPSTSSVTLSRAEERSLFLPGSVAVSVLTITCVSFGVGGGEVNLSHLSRLHYEQMTGGVLTSFDQNVKKKKKKKK